MTIWKDERAKQGQQWKVRIINAGGQREQRSFATQKLALDWELQERKTRQEVDAGLAQLAPRITFGELVELWKANYPSSNWKLSQLKYAVDRWGDVQLRAMEPEGIGAWLHNLEGPRKGSLSAQTKTHILTVMRQVLNAGVEWGYLFRSPARPGAFQSPGKRRLAPIRPFESWAEVEAVAAAIGKTGALVRFVCATGIRSPSEWWELRWRDLDLKDRSAMIHGTKTDSAPRTIPLGKQALAALSDLPRGLPGTLVFTGINYEDWRRYEWRNALAAVGLEDRNPYQMRHTFATLALEAGANIEDVQKVMGHDDIAVTLRYYRKWTRPMLDRFRDVLDTIDTEDSDEAAGEA